MIIFAEAGGLQCCSSTWWTLNRWCCVGWGSTVLPWSITAYTKNHVSGKKRSVTHTHNTQYMLYIDQAIQSFLDD